MKCAENPGDVVYNKVKRVFEKYIMLHTMTGESHNLNLS